MLEMLQLIFIGLSAGFAVSGGIFAFITMIGIPPRLAGRTHTAKHMNLYENILILGAALGNLAIVFNISIPGGRVFLGIMGIFTGIFVGCMALSLAEALKAIPIFAHRISLKKGIPLLILSTGLGKLCGSLFQFFFS